MKKLIHKVLFSKVHRIAMCALLLASTNVWAPTGIMAGVSDAGPDATLSLILRDIAQDKLDVALTRTENLLKIYPKFPARSPDSG